MPEWSIGTVCKTVWRYAYRRFKSLPVPPGIIMTANKCKLCDKPTIARGLCSKHYTIYYRSDSFKKAERVKKINKKKIKYLPCKFCGRPTRSKIQCCRECYYSSGLKNEKDKKDRAEKITKIIKMLGGKCVHCGSTVNLEIDHLYPADKSFTIGQRMSKPFNELVEEAKKCQLLCRKCHIAKSTIERQRHGSNDMANKCECPKCLQTKRINNLRRIRKNGKMVGYRTKEEAIAIYISKYGQLI